jgi:hypothetical protein
MLPISFISLNKAYELTLTKKDAVKLQLKAWRFRDVRPRNRAGWMIQAIESNYDVPGSYSDDKEKGVGEGKGKPGARGGACLRDMRQHWLSLLHERTIPKRRYAAMHTRSRD